MNALSSLPAREVVLSYMMNGIHVLANERDDDRSDSVTDLAQQQSLVRAWSSGRPRSSEANRFSLSLSFSAGKTSNEQERKKSARQQEKNTKEKFD